MLVYDYPIVGGGSAGCVDVLPLFLRGEHDEGGASAFHRIGGAQPQRH